MVLLDSTETGLPTAGVVNLSRLLTISQARLLPPRGEQIPRAVGHVGYPKMAEVDEALRLSLGLG